MSQKIIVGAAQPTTQLNIHSKTYIYSGWMHLTHQHLHLFKEYTQLLNFKKSE